MKTSHKIIAIVLFFLSIIVFYTLNVSLSEATIQCLVTFFSIVFGFYITSIAILYNASYSKSLYNDRKYDKDGKTGLHILKSYFVTCGYWAVFSIIVTISYLLFSNVNQEGKIFIHLDHLDIPYTSISIDLSLLAASGVIAISIVNVFFMFLLLKAILNGMIAEAQNDKNN